MNEHPLEKFPERTPLDIIDTISKYIKDKTICDIGCGAGDLLYQIKKLGLSDKIIGIERNEKRGLNGRDFIIIGDFTKLNIPKCDAYLIWLGFDQYDVINNLPNSIIIDLTSEPTKNHLNKMNNRLHLIEKKSYHYNESKYGKDKKYDDNKWPLIGERNVFIYEKK
jgi:16S rRNA A1518/A1519 N6-dimethyltransferase RsmA/KsgA/DIM1 with predicted DNA glycosylase/AP lyase activity